MHDALYKYKSFEETRCKIITLSLLPPPWYEMLSCCYFCLLYSLYNFVISYSVKQFLALVRKMDVNLDTISTKVNSALARLEEKYDVSLALYQRFEKWVKGHMCLIHTKTVKWKILIDNSMFYFSEHAKTFLHWFLIAGKFDSWEVVLFITLFLLSV